MNLLDCGNAPLLVGIMFFIGVLFGIQAGRCLPPEKDGWNPGTFDMDAIFERCKKR